MKESTVNIEFQNKQLSQYKDKILQNKLDLKYLESKVTRYEEQIHQLNDKNHKLEESLRNRA